MRGVVVERDHGSRWGPSGVPYIVEMGDSVEAPEFSRLIGGDDRRVNPPSL